MTGDIFHWDGGGNVAHEHFANFLMSNDAGVPEVFSRSGENGRFEIKEANSEKFNGYGAVDSIYHRN